jgi:hypothetical protein
MSNKGFAVGRFMHSALWGPLGFMFVLSACAADSGAEQGGSEPYDEEIGADHDVVGQKQYFQNNLAFSNCGTSQQARVSQAAQILSNRIYENGGTTMRACLADQFFGTGVAPNTLWALYNREGVTTIQCTDSVQTACGNVTDWWGCASPTASGETIMLANQMINDPSFSITEIAGVMGHELAHNYGYVHLGEPGGIDYESSIPQRVRACVTGSGSVAGVPSTTSRTVGMPGEVELSMYGNYSGGAPNEKACPTWFINSLQVRSGTEIDNLGIRCKGETPFSQFGGTGGGLAPSTSTTCGSNELMVGLRGRSGSLVNQLQVVCASATNLSATRSLPAVGGTGGVVFESICPAGTAVSRIRTRSGTMLDAVQLVCRSPAAPSLFVEQSIGSQSGTASGVMTRLRCSGDGALVGFFGRTGTLVDRLGAVCQSTTRSGSTLTLGNKHVASPILGGTGGGEFVKSCSANNLMVGFRVQSGSSVDAIGPICAWATTWASDSASAPNLLTMNGGSGGAAATRQCGDHEFLVGLDIWSGSLINAVRPVCRRLL